MRYQEEYTQKIKISGLAQLGDKGHLSVEKHQKQPYSCSFRRIYFQHGHFSRTASRAPP